ncbi:MAG: hypothetical protein AAGJ46_15775 [Planctomycetota bacterium]
MKKQRDRFTSSCVVLVLATLCCGCTSVTVNHLIGSPTGDKAPDGRSLAEALDGVWMPADSDPADSDAATGAAANDDGLEMLPVEGEEEAQDSPVFVKYLGDGKLRLAFMYWEDDQFKIDSGDFFLSQAGSRVYIHMPSLSEDEERPASARRGGKYDPAWLKIGEDSLTCYTLESEWFLKQHEAGRIAAKRVQEEWVEDGVEMSIDELMLTGSSEELAKLFGGQKPEDLFDMESPMEFRRIAPLSVESPESEQAVPAEKMAPKMPDPPPLPAPSPPEPVTVIREAPP